MSSEAGSSHNEFSPEALLAHGTVLENTGLERCKAPSKLSTTPEYLLGADAQELYSPAEMLAVEPIDVDTPPFDVKQLRNRLLPKPLACAIGPSIDRATDVKIEGHIHSEVAKPVEREQQVVGHSDIDVLTASGLIAHGSQAKFAEQVINQYTRNYDSGVEASYHYTVAFLNPGSGETGVAHVMLDALRDELGTKRVMTLCGEVFANPATLRLLIKEQAVIYHPPGQPPRQQRGTVVACGGDGTVSFLLKQLDLVRTELELEFEPITTRSQQETTPLHRERSHSATSRLLKEVKHPFFTMPALAPLPLGTGNDFSNCTGFGCQLSLNGNGWCGLCSLLRCESEADVQVAEALRKAVTAPSVSFDRWEVSLVPLRVAQAAVRPESSQAAFEAGQGATSQMPSDGSVAASDQAATPSGAEGLHSPLWNRAAWPSNVANSVYNVDWDQVYSSGQCVTHGLINYLGVGFDAYVTKRFDTTRRAHPAVCSTRSQNKAVYGMIGLQSAFKCKKLRKIIPMICVPRPELTRVDGTAKATSSMRGKRDLVALQLPSTAKALVLTNVNCYSAGMHPWNPQRGEPYYRPITLRNGELRPTTATGTGDTPEEPLLIPTPRPVAINDHIFELQAMGGILHYTSLGIGISSSTKLLQTDEMFVFVLCTPEDLHFPSGQCSTYTRLHLKDKYEARIESDNSLRASLNVQIDGEPMPRITESTVIHVRRQPGAWALIRCRNPSIVQ
ncbi:hypothetical protein JKF63_05339 [Porcisia hertigi]|uniref:diacylglycerol kinase (ATP) n=1 Tax=Porcisia hertigi TaxID=2761500 RepID=A0A836LFS1_9TRYP|nr:hypothetical protein JKF63_05339 [Porcisia hertigi]